MKKEIKKALVIGAGTVGGGTAAILANAGLQVYLIDIPSKDPEKDRNDIAKQKVADMRKASSNPAKDPINGALLHPYYADRIAYGNTEDDLARFAKEADLVIESIPDVLAWKKPVYKKVFAAVRPGTIVGSTTSTLLREKLVADMTPEQKRDFLILHPFNPVRFMDLVEVVRGPEVDYNSFSAVCDLFSNKCGKLVLDCKDKPGFIANRIGVYFIMRAFQEALDRGIPIEEVDAVFGRPLGMPKSGVFGTLDFVGLGLIPHVVQNFVEMLDKNDPFRRLNYHRAVDIVNEMVKDGRTGRQAKGDKGGFYRLEKDDDGKKRAKESVNLLTQEYAVSEKPKLKTAKAGLKGPRAVLEAKDKHGAMAWAVMRDTLLYAAALVPEIADRIQDVDAAMRGGFGWEYGPFEMIDKFGIKYEREEGLTGAYNRHAPWKKDVAGVSWFIKRAQRDGCVIPPLLQLAKDRFFYKIDENGDKQALDFNFESGYASYQPMRTPRGIVSLDDIKRHSEPLIERESASVWDIGDGVLCCEFHSLKNMIDPCILRVINDTNRMIRESQGLYKGLVFYNDYNYFSPGANLPLIGGKLLWSRNPLNMINDLIVHPNLGVPAYKTLGIPRFASDKLHKGVNKVLNLIEKGFEAVSFEYRRKAGNDYITDIVYQGQAVLDALHKAPFPSVAALHRFCLGGAYEIAANCSAIQAHAETNAGLPEMGVGLKPGWTGHIRLLERIMDSPELAGEDIYQPVSKTFLNVMAPVMSISMSAADAFMKYWMRPDKDGITMNRNRLLTDAKARVLELADGYEPPKPRTFNLPGKTAWASLQTGADAFYLKGLATWYDLEIADAVGDTVTGGDTHRGISIHQNDMYHREFENFRSLLENDHTLKRILHMVATNKPLREDEGPGRGITPHEIRRLRMPVTLPKRPFTGEPLEGEEESRLKAYARHSSVFRWAVKKAGLG